MAYRLAPDVQKPSEQLFDLLMGNIAWNDAPESIRSWAQKPIYDAAHQILEMPDKAKRQRALAKIPQAIRPKIEAEIMRLYSSR
jgi:hypothetical protein